MIMHPDRRKRKWKKYVLKAPFRRIGTGSGNCGDFWKKIGKADFKELKIGYVPQNSISGNKDFPATVEEVMMTGLYRPFKKRLSRKACRQKITVALTELGMESFLKRRTVSFPVDSSSASCWQEFWQPDSGTSHTG